MGTEKNLAICISLGNSGDRFQKQTHPRLGKHLDGERPKFRCFPWQVYLWMCAPLCTERNMLNMLANFHNC